ncbi:sugar ABC transporter substrate-binding protein [Actinomycetes bacterium KLBMP 9759]
MTHVPLHHPPEKTLRGKSELTRRTVLRALAALPLPVAASAACSSSGPAFNPGGGRASIGYAVWDKDQVPAMQQVIDEFRKDHPDVEVTIQLTPFVTYWTRLRTSITGGGAADVFWMNAPNIQKFARYGTLLPLGERLRAAGEALADHPQNLVELYRYGGEQYGIPKDFDTISLYYNRELFDAAGIGYPDETWTWQHVVDAAGAMRDPARSVFGYAAPLDRQRALYPAIFQNDGWVLRDGRSGFADDTTIGGLRHLTNMIDKGFSPNAMAIADTNERSLMQSGKVAMMTGLPNDANALYKDERARARTGIAVLPRGRRRATVIHGLANVVNARTPFPDACFEFVRFMANRVTGEIQGRSGAILPSFAGTQQAYLDSRPEFRLQSFIDQVPDATAYPASVNTESWEAMQLQVLGPSWVGRGGRPVEQSARLLANDMDVVLAKESA